VNHAIDIFERRYPYHQALFAFDNAPSHQKRAPDSLSARHMPKESRHWEPYPGIRMRDTVLTDGTTQELYFPAGHPKAGQFKGMKQLLVEHGIWPGKAPRTGKELLSQCKNFICPEGITNCCT
jgi:hypothetical protein